ncbi:tyrosine-type recombinase/integrase [Staphylococcus simiae]|uniref:tyrosine-type recombinase/integrase n=1 Tax=Staphylococcus simiae TaxID=308354 RepID=UPI001A97794D|nr:tyrosine-type recombinase/integrase [Staphylococcus simiae]MBO1199928.1 tyrosine-type recombinase/integrase [Staphylococcus simiae]MBO1201606.1 tyrosine-type recombinase/integrase [Staphylococcus simiae]MBO1203727.1 tyrosine-type recombinase/integrase [Staphylococcus simiae]MBO1212017.1 tyrosine-type recombinase/integrase [Staphylococcus simiae]MBO1230011.1 tyrosine-type recombinase/integrase [Staphylococcus simiae]
MNKVEPIKKIEDIEKMYKVLKAKSLRDYLFFKLAIHTGYKVCELLTLTVQQVKSLVENEGLHIISHQQAVNIKVKLPENLISELLSYIEVEALNDEDFMFQSTRTHKILSRQQAYRIIHQAAIEAEVPHIGLTTLRKTFALHAYLNGIPISVIQKYLGHQTSIETLKFIGKDVDDEQCTFISLNL